MRCQWGLTWDTMKPWIAARRFKEFSYLDTQVYTLCVSITAQITLYIITVYKTVCILSNMGCGTMYILIKHCKSSLVVL